MRSRWYELKPRAISLRKGGASYRVIELNLGVPKSTLSCWLSGIALTDRQSEILRLNKIAALKATRKNAIAWHNKQKADRISVAEDEAKVVLKGFDVEDKKLLVLCLSLLYLGEGAKKNSTTSIGSSDPLILNLFIAVLIKVFEVEIGKIRCDLNLRADQDPEEMKGYWSEVLKLPLSCFKTANLDKRTLGRRTYPGYNGVCQVSCGAVAIQRQLVALSRLYCEKVVNTLRA